MISSDPIPVPAPVVDRSDDPPPQRPQRVAWLDGAKGIGIVLVVIGHALGGLIDAGSAPLDRSFQGLFSSIYTFHMPLFLLLSALLVGDRIKRPPRAYFKPILSDIVYPYFLWSTIQLVVVMLAGTLVNRPMPSIVGSILGLPFLSTGQFWFFYALFLLHTVAFFVSRRFGVWAFFALTLVGAAFWEVIAAHWHMLAISARHSIWYSLGLLIGVSGISRGVRQLGRPIPCLFLIVALIVTLFCVGPITEPGWPALALLKADAIARQAWTFGHFPIALLGVTTVIALAGLLRGSVAQGFAMLGERSMPIFVLHVIVVAGTRILLRKVGIGDPYVLLYLSIVSGIAFPVIAFECAKALRITRYLGLGRG